MLCFHSKTVLLDSRGGRGHLGDQIGHSKCNRKGLIEHSFLTKTVSLVFV